MTEDALTRLTQMMTMLRSPEKGCPWDKKQTFQSLVPHTLEETHEVIAAIEQQDFQDLKDELGDLLFQIVFYSQLATERDEFDFIDVINHLVEKMQRRHPHVFAEKEFKTESELSRHWELIKSTEKKASPTAQLNSVLDNVPRTMPALSRSQKLQNRAAKTGFDWNDVNKVKQKLYEELDELDEAIELQDQKNIEHEVGDLIIVCVNLARHLGVDAEQALRLANQRFENRFRYIENHFHEKNENITQSELKELELLWQQAKEHLKDN